MTKPFDSPVHKQWRQDFSFWWHFHWHEYLLLRNELSILSKWHSFAGYQLGFAVCTNCFEKCTNSCANVDGDERNAPKRLRKTVKQLNNVSSATFEELVSGNENFNPSRLSRCSPYSVFSSCHCPSSLFWCVFIPLMKMFCQVRVTFPPLVLIAGTELNFVVSCVMFFL